MHTRNINPLKSLYQPSTFGVNFLKLYFHFQDNRVCRFNLDCKFQTGSRIIIFGVIVENTIKVACFPISSVTFTYC